MSLSQSVRRTALCGACRTQVLQSFISVARVSFPTAQYSQSWHRSTAVARPTSFSTYSQRRGQHAKDSAAVDPSTNATLSPSDLPDADIKYEASEDLPSDLDEAVIEPLSSAEPHPSQSQSAEAAVPWYLQLNSPIAPQEHTLSGRQRLPELPPHSPALLKPILEHVSVDLGLDDLSLLDLRAIDPPPALGANLIMVIGTARSEKHLHVSADRLCRWLRSNYDMSPYADGLLGRNELKLKMRRKAKRSRLLSAVGAKETGASDVDDGIRTGWVCVNVGKVEGGILPEQREKDARQVEGFVGFGAQSTACRIVVQMMTDQKRGEIDLESLWEGILRRSTNNPPKEKQTSGPTDTSIQSDSPNSSASSRAPPEKLEVYRPTL